MRAVVKSFPALLIGAILAMGLAACGASAGASSGQGFRDEPAAQTVVVRVDSSGRLAWDRTAYRAVAGDVTFVVENPSGLAHNFAVEGDGVKAQSKSFNGGATNRFTLRGLAPGTYTLACTLPGHREAGMVAALEVR